MKVWCRIHDVGVKRAVRTTLTATPADSLRTASSSCRVTHAAARESSRHTNLVVDMNLIRVGAVNQKTCFESVADRR